MITGASSGIGRATALAFARQGASVVVAARREGPLHEVATQSQNLGAQALAVPTDVTDEAQVQELARRAIANFGRIDVWVNNAAVTMFAPFEEAPPDAFRRVIETNLFGYIYGTRAVLPYFREQGNGVLINISSIVGTVGQPYTSAYVSAKFAIRGFSECLRQELRGTDIHVCTVMPASIDTPLFQHGANYMGRTAKPVPPIYDAEQVAQAILRCAEHPSAEVFVGNAGYLPGRLHNVLHTFVPGLHERLVARAVEKQHFTDRPTAPSPGNVFEPMPEWTSVSGGWKQPRGTPIGRLALAGLVALVPVAAAWLRSRSGLSAALPGIAAAVPVVGKQPTGVWKFLIPAARALLSVPAGSDSRARS